MKIKHFRYLAKKDARTVLKEDVKCVLEKLRMEVYKLRIENGELRIVSDKLAWLKSSSSENNIGAIPSLIREGVAPMLMTDLGNLHHDRHSEAEKHEDPSLTLRMAGAEESHKNFQFPILNFQLKNHFPFQLPRKNSQFSILHSQFKKAAFTLAEVLITLGVIGVVAAITMPVLIKNYQNHVTVSKLKKVYSTLSQIMVKSYADNGSASEFLSSGTDVSAETTEKFFETYWLQYFKVPVVAKDGRYTFYQSNKPYKYIDGNVLSTGIYTQYPHGRILFKTQDGVIYYMDISTWDITKDDEGNIIEQKAVYYSKIVIYADINGTNPPNTLGKDVFTFTVDNTANKITPTSHALQIMQNGWKINY